MMATLEDLCEALGWQGGTIHDALDEVRKLKASKKVPELYDSEEALSPFGREADGIAYVHVNRAIDELLAKGLTVRQATLLLYEVVSFITSVKILDKRAKNVPKDPT
jgi:hypothetical protein